MSQPGKYRGQTGVETILITGVILSLLVVLGTFYFGSTSDQTTAIIILKTELLKQFGRLGTNYVIISSLEPVISGDNLCFEVKTNPALSNADKTALENALPGIISKISSKTRYKNPTINLESDCP